MQIKYNMLTTQDLSFDLFEPFNRYQDVNQCWRKNGAQWVLKDISFVENWSSADKEFLIDCLKNTLNTNGYVIGAFCGDVLVAFASLESTFFGSSKQYLQLSSLHVSYEFRGKGIGKTLFYMVCQHAKIMGAKKIYISAHSSKESQAFYKNIGCVEAIELNKTLAEKEPCDCQLEYNLQYLEALN